MVKAIAQDADGRFIVQTAGGDPKADAENAYGRIVIPEISEVAPEILIASIIAQSNGVDWREITDQDTARQAEELVRAQT